MIPGLHFMDLHAVAILLPDLHPNGREQVSEKCSTSENGSHF